MTKQEMIDAIYKEIADKTKNPWYRIFSTEEFIYSNIRIWDVLDWWHKKSMAIPLKSNNILSAEEEMKKLNNKSFRVVKQILQIYREYRKPLEGQWDECIEYIYNIIK